MPRKKLLIRAITTVGAAAVVASAPLAIVALQRWRAARATQVGGSLVVLHLQVPLAGLFADAWGLQA